MPATPLDEGARILTICNSCRYCEGYCAVFPAMELRQEFHPPDLNYLANLCHNCSECLYACQYAPPHEFKVNVPQTLAQIRVDSYSQYSSPSWLFGRPALLHAVALILGVVAFMSVPHSTIGSNFYQIIPHQIMATGFGLISLFVLAILTIGLLRFWRENPARPSLPAVTQALRDALTLKYLQSAGPGCPYPEHSHARRWFHHATFYGFLLCFASTSVAAFYHYALDKQAPYDYLTLPVILGTLGGLGLLAGPAGLYFLKRKQDPDTTSSGQKSLDTTFIALLFLTSLTGLLLLGLRETRAMPGLLVIHLATVLVLFLTLPYGKFVHGIYRSAALIRYSMERSE